MSEPNEADFPDACAYFEGAVGGLETEIEELRPVLSERVIGRLQLRAKQFRICINELRETKQ